MHLIINLDRIRNDDTTAPKFLFGGTCIFSLNSCARIRRLVGGNSQSALSIKIVWSTR